jgi:uncharacterized protein YbbC (DUF1343 family)
VFTPEVLESKTVKVKTGLDVLMESNAEALQKLRIGILCHPASVDHNLRHIIGLFNNHPEIQLTTILGPQHGARGETQDNMIEWDDYRDATTSLRVFSLYGKTRKPTPEMLSDVDVLVCDLQDVGARYYTFIHTMALSMEACREEGKGFMVLDRPNPIGGLAVEGTVLKPDFRSFVGLHPLPIRHGMTIGEIAHYVNRFCNIECRLEVIRMEGWEREYFFDQTELPWVFPSPNMPRLETALVYPGLCLLEGTNVSEGRGTTLPFEISGAPWIDPNQLVESLNEMHLPGVTFRPTHFVPTFQKWSGHMLGGVQIHIQDRSTFKPFLTGVALVKTYRELGRNQFEWLSPPYEYEYTLWPFDILCGTGRIREMIEEGASVDLIESSWKLEESEFLDVRQQCLLYRGVEKTENEG